MQHYEETYGHATQNISHVVSSVPKLFTNKNTLQTSWRFPNQTILSRAIQGISFNSNFYTVTLPTQGATDTRICFSGLMLLVANQSTSHIFLWFTTKLPRPQVCNEWKISNQRIHPLILSRPSCGVTYKSVYSDWKLDLSASRITATNYKSSTVITALITLKAHSIFTFLELVFLPTFRFLWSMPQV
jgi:hypothetical protein